MRRDHLKRKLALILATSFNLVIFFSIIWFFEGWGQVFIDPVMFGFLTVLSAFCIAECWEGSKKNEVIVCNRETYLDVILTGLTGGLLFLVFAISLGEHLVAPSGIDIGPRATGTVFACLGIFLRVAAFRALGSAFVSLPQVRTGQRLIVKGPYSFLRHPSETGLMCISLGMVWMMGSTTGFFITVLLLLPISYLRVTREERVLTKNFEQAYVNYKNAVPGIIPVLSRFRS